MKKKNRKKLNAIWTKTKQILNKEVLKKQTDSLNATNVWFLGFCFIPIK